jgi:hypothetical protein
MDNFKNTQPVLVTTLENHGEIHYVYSSAVSPIGLDFAGMGLMATIAFVATKKWFNRKHKSASLSTQEIETETENPNRPRTFSCARFYSRLDNKKDPFENQYDHWVIPEPQPRKSAKDMTREEILAEAGIKL